jgi:hypothetical protein
MATLAEELRKKQKASEGEIAGVPAPVLKSDNGPGDILGGTQKGFEQHVGGAIGGAAGNPFAVREAQRATAGTGGDPRRIGKNLSTSVEGNLNKVGKAAGQAFDYIFGKGGATQIAQADDPTKGFEDKVGDVMSRYRSQMQPVEVQQVGAGVDGMQTSQAGFTDAIRAQQVAGTSYDPTLAGRTQIGQATTFQGASIDPSQQSQFRAQQEALGAQIQNAPSIAEAQGKLAQEDAVRRAMSQAASARGGNIALAQRAGQQLLAEESAKIAGQTQLAAAQELSQRQQLLAQIAQQGREQDLQLATQQAQLAQQAGIQAAELGTKVTLSQAELDQTRELTNAALATDASKWTAQSSFDAAKANQDASLKADIQTALNNIDVSKFNANAQNQMEQFKADANLRANIANQAADLQAKGMNLDAISKQMGVEIDALKSLLGASTAVYQTKQQSNAAQAQMESQRKAGILGGVASGVASFFTKK